MRTSSPRPQGRPLPLAVALVVALVALAGCGEEAATVAGEGGIDHPTGGDELVLRIAHEGGFLPVGRAFATVPDLSVYGDGRVITHGPQIEIFPPPALPSLVQRQAGEDGVQSLLAAAEEAGLLGEPPDYGQPPLADATTTVVTIHARGRTYRHAAYGLTEGDSMPTPGLTEEQEAAREALAGFVGSVLGPGGPLAEDELGGEEPYVADAFAVSASPVPDDPAGAPEDDPAPDGAPGDGEHVDDGVEPTTEAWPLPEVDLDTARECLVVDGEAADRLRQALQTANQLTRFEQDGTTYELAARPLLPDDDGCPPGS